MPSDLSPSGMADYTGGGSARTSSRKKEQCNINNSSPFGKGCKDAVMGCTSNNNGQAIKATHANDVIVPSVGQYPDGTDTITRTFERHRQRPFQLDE